jgi:hypothetical protein
MQALDPIHVDEDAGPILRIFQIDRLQPGHRVGEQNHAHNFNLRLNLEDPPRKVIGVARC